MKKIAIACQGGGSHTAFTAGVLQALLQAKLDGAVFNIVALTGTYQPRRGTVRSSTETYLVIERAARGKAI